jgi:hypothetical protein
MPTSIFGGLLNLSVASRRDSLIDDRGSSPRCRGLQRAPQNITEHSMLTWATGGTSLLNVEVGVARCVGGFELSRWLLWVSNARVRRVVPDNEVVIVVVVLIEGFDISA